MLSMRFLAVRDVPCPAVDSSTGVSANQVRWSIQVQHGLQRQRTRSIELPETKRRGADEDPEGAATALWDEEVEIHDNEGQDTVEIALLLDLQATMTQGRKKFRHSIATMEMEAFRPHPEKRVTCWIPLRPATSCPEDSFGSIQLAVTYSDDYVAQGYMFGLFCGLAPFSLSHLWAHEPLFKLSGSADDVRSDRLRSPRRSLSSSERRGYSAPPIIPATAAGPNGLTSASNESEESGMLAALASGPGASTVST